MNRLNWWFRWRILVISRWWDHGQWRGFSSHMQKACEDHFEYALGLRDGTVFYFREAERDGRDWLHLSPVTSHNVPSVDGERQFTFERGLQVRIADIAWISDAPFGS